MHEVLSELRGLCTYVGERFDSLDGRIDAIDARFAGMDTHITQLEEDISYVRQCFDLPPPSS